MKHLLKINALVLALMAIVLVGCNENEDPTDPGTAPNAPTALAAQSVSESTIGLRWTVSATGATATGFVVEYNEKGTTTKLEKTVSGSTTNTTTVSSLTEGKIYEFVVYAVNGTKKSPASPKVEWAPARRGTQTFRLYSSDNTANGSGLGIFRAGGPAVLTISNGGEWDLCFDDKEAGNGKIGSPGQSKYVDNNFQFPNGQDAKVVYINNEVYSNVTSLDDIYESTALTLPSSNGEAMFPINSLPASTAGTAFVMGTRDESDGKYYFAKVLLKKANGTYVQGTGANSYIEVDVSYQTVKDVPYAVKAKFDRLMQEARSTPRQGTND